MLENNANIYILTYIRRVICIEIKQHRYLKIAALKTSIQRKNFTQTLKG